MISDLKNVAEKLPGYTTIDTKIMYERENISAFIGVNNIFNKKYTEYGVVDATATLLVFYPAPERNYDVGLSLKF
jgi:outer membrane receptor protein involved in Fe transport